MPNRNSNWGIDSFPIYTHFGYESFTYERLGDRNAPKSQWNLTSEFLLLAHLYRLEAGLGIAFEYWYNHYPKTSDLYLGYRPSRGWLLLRDAWLRLPLSTDPQGSAIQAGVMPLQSHANAILLGNYLVRKNPHHDWYRYRETELDSLGSLAPTASGIALHIGNRENPVRADLWLLTEDDDYSAVGLITGNAPLGLEWGLGFCAYRFISSRDPQTYWLLESIEDTIPDRITWSNRDYLLAGHASIDLASLLGNDAIKGQYGSLFAEAALFGLKHNPFVTLNRYERIIWTLGTHLPTFGWLDDFVVQFEKRPQWQYRAELMRGWDFQQVSPWSAGVLLSKKFGTHLSFQFRAITGKQTTQWDWYFGDWYYSPWAEPLPFMGLDRPIVTKCLGRLVVRLP